MDKNIILKIIILLVLMIVLIMTWLLIMKRNEQNDLINLSNETEIVEEEIDNQWHNIDNINTYYTVEHCIQNLFKFHSNNNFKAVYNILDLDYIKDNDINEDNISEKFDYKGNFTFISTNQVVKEDDYNLSTYLVEGLLINTDNRNSEQKCFIVKLDWELGKFSIYPLNEKNMDIQIKNTINNEEENKDNEFNLVNLSDNQIARVYYNIIKFQIIYNKDNIYNLIDQDNLETNFNNSKDSLYKYIEEIDDELYNSNLIKYNIQYNDKNTTYKLLDSKNNQFTIVVNESMQLKIKIEK